MSFPDWLPRSLRRNFAIVDDHWIWMRSTNRGGYGVIGWNEKVVLVHRLSAHLFHGLDLESKLLVLHKPPCLRRDCWNPEHLYVGTKFDNIKDSIEAGTFRSPWLDASKKEQCKNGHDFTAINTYIRPDDRRGCRSCRTEAVYRNKKVLT